MAARKPFDVSFKLSDASSIDLEKAFARAMQNGALKGLSESMRKAATLHGPIFSGTPIPVDDQGRRAPGPYLPAGHALVGGGLISRDAARIIAAEMGRNILGQGPAALEAGGNAAAKSLASAFNVSDGKSGPGAMAIQAIVGNNIISKAIAEALKQVILNAGKDASKSLGASSAPAFSRLSQGLGAAAGLNTQTSAPPSAPEPAPPASKGGALEAMGYRHAGLGRLGEIAAIVGVDRLASSAISKVQSAFSQATANIENFGATAKYSGYRGGQAGFRASILRGGDIFGYSDDQESAFTRSYLGSTNTSGVGAARDVRAGLGFAAAYGLDPTAYGTQLGQFGNQLGYLGAGPGRMSLAAFQGTIQAAYGNNANVRMDDYLAGFASLSRGLMGQSGSTPNMSSALGLYNAFNQSGNAALAGQNGAALLERMNAGMAAVGTGANPAARAIAYQLMAQKTGRYMSPAEFQYHMDKGISDPAFATVLQGVHGMYTDKYARYMAEGQMLGLNPAEMESVDSALFRGGKFVGGKFASKLIADYKNPSLKADDRQRVLDTLPDKAWRDVATNLQGIWGSMKRDEAGFARAVNGAVGLINKLFGGGGDSPWQAIAINAGLLAGALGTAAHTIVGSLAIKGIKKAGGALLQSRARRSGGVGSGAEGGADTADLAGADEAHRLARNRWRALGDIGLDEHPAGIDAASLRRREAFQRAALDEAHRVPDNSDGHVIRGDISASLTARRRLARLDVQHAGELADFNAPHADAYRRSTLRRAAAYLRGRGAAGFGPDPATVRARQALLANQASEREALARRLALRDAGSGFLGVVGVASLGYDLTKQTRANALRMHAPYYTTGNPMADANINPTFAPAAMYQTLLDTGGGFASWGNQVIHHPSMPSWGDVGQTLANGLIPGFISDPISALTAGWLGGSGRGHTSHSSFRVGGGGAFDPASEMRLQKAMRDHQNATGQALVVYQTGANAKTENIIATVLGQTVLDAQAARNIDTNSRGFMSSISKAISDWVKGLFTSVQSQIQAGMMTASGSLGGTPGDLGGSSAVGGASGLNTFKGWTIAAPWGKDQGGLFKSFHDVEHGVVFGAQAGTAVKLPTGARFDRARSGQYESIFDLADGRAMDFMHIDPRSFANGQYLAAGTTIGTVTSAQGDGYRGWMYAGGTKTYASTGNVTEFGVYDNPQDAARRNYGGDQDPIAFLNSLGQGGAMMGGAASLNGQALSPQLLALYRKAAAKYGVPVSFLIAQGYKESGWRAGARSADGGYGIAQFTGGTGAQYLGGAGWQRRAMDPTLAIDAQGHLMHDLLAREHGNLQAAARDYNGSGYAADQYAGSLMNLMGQVQLSGGSVAGGSSVYGAAPMAMAQQVYGAAMQQAAMSMTVAFEPLTIVLRYPGGHTESVRVNVKQKMAGVQGGHSARVHGAHGGHSGRRH